MFAIFERLSRFGWNWTFSGKIGSMGAGLPWALAEDAADSNHSCVG